jgi:hypothetical protein
MFKNLKLPVFDKLSGYEGYFAVVCCVYLSVMSYEIFDNLSDR